MEVNSNTKTELTPEMQAQIEQMVSARLTEQSTKHAQEIEAIRAEARRRLAAVAPGAATDVELFLQEESAEDARKAERIRVVGKYFGPRADYVASNKLALEKKALWRSLQAEAHELGLI